MARAFARTPNHARRRPRLLRWRRMTETGMTAYRLIHRLLFISNRGNVPDGTVVMGTRNDIAVSKLRSRFRTNPATSRHRGLGSICKLISGIALLTLNS